MKKEETIKLAEEYFRSDKTPNAIHPSQIPSYAKRSADFAQFYHKQEMEKVIENMRVKKVDHYNAGGDFGINERDGYHLAICDLSDLTKTE